MLRQVVTFLLGHLVFALLLGVGLRTTGAELTSAMQRPGLLARAVLVANLAVPLLAVLLMAVMPLNPRIEALILLLAICPGAPFFLNRFKTEISRPAVLLLLVSVFGMVSVPMWIWAINTVFPYHFQSSPGQVLMLLAKSVLLPLAIGLLVRRFLPRFAPGLARLAGMFYKVALVVAIPVLLYIGAPVVLHAPLLGLLTVLVLTVACALLGHWAGGPDPDDRRTLALLAALGNPALALAIAVNSYPDAKPGALVIAYVLLRALCLLPYTLWNKRHHQPPRAHPAPAPA